MIQMLFGVLRLSYFKVLKRLRQNTQNTYNRIVCVYRMGIPLGADGQPRFPCDSVHIVVPFPTYFRVDRQQIRQTISSRQAVGNEVKTYY